MDPSWMCDRIRVVCGRGVGEAEHRDGLPDPAILDPGAGVEGARAGWAREAVDAARRAAGGLRRPERPGRPDRRVLPPPRGFLLLWARRGEWDALCLSRLEVRP